MTLKNLELVSTGSELLSGRTVNRHARVLGEKLKPLGLQLARDTTVPDGLDVIKDAVRSALERTDVVIVSGGLGATSDDLSREAVASYLGREVVPDEHSLARIKDRFRESGRVLSKQGERQARVVEGAVVLDNLVGSAPGQRLDHDGKAIFMLPGPPGEFVSMLDRYVVPWLEEQCPDLDPPVERVFYLSGIGESDVVRMLEESGNVPDDLELAYCAGPGRVEVRLQAEKENAAGLEQAARGLREVFAEYIFSEERMTMEEVLGQMLTEKSATLATAESCTGGLISDRVTSVSGSSSYFLGGVVSYSNQSKVRELGVSQDDLDRLGAVSEAVARQMALGVRERFGADYGIGVTGIAGPTGGTEEKPVGLVYISVADADGCTVVENRLPGDRTWVKERTCQRAMDLLRRKILGWISP